jgi:hypothetical protein
MSKDNKLTIITVSVVVLALLVGGGAFALYKHNHPNDTVAVTTNNKKTNPPSGTLKPPSPPPSDKDANGCYTPETVRKHYGENDCVDYNVGYTYETSAGTKFLDQLVDYTSGFVGYIPWDSAASGINLSSLDGKDIKVTGLIQEYNGYPEIIINNSSQVSAYQ